MLRALTTIVFIFSTNLYAADSTKDLKLEAAERYLKATPVDSLMNDMVASMARNMQPKQAKEFESLMLKHVDIERIENIMLTAMVKHFSLAELNALADFYGSEIGKSAMKKFGAYMAEAQPAIQQEIQRAVIKLKSSPIK